MASTGSPQLNMLRSQSSIILEVSSGHSHKEVFAQMQLDRHIFPVQQHQKKESRLPVANCLNIQSIHTIVSGKESTRVVVGILHSWSCCYCKKPINATNATSNQMRCAVLLKPPCHSCHFFQRLRKLYAVNLIWAGIHCVDEHITSAIDRRQAQAIRMLKVEALAST